jgi:sulfopyruvate decarboxylase subunit alpha
VGICAGAYLTGLRPVLLVQNSGLLNSCNALVTLNQLYQIPLLMLVTLRGGLGEPIFYHMPLGRWTVPVLEALRVPHWVVQTPEEAETVVADAMTSALSSRLPAAVLLTRTSTYEGQH